VPCDPSHVRTVTVRGGKANDSGFLFQVYTPVYGDVTNNVYPDAVVPYSCTGADFGGEKAFVYTGTASQRRMVADLPGRQGPSSIDRIAIQGAVLVLSGRGYSPTTAHCCPDLRITTRYQWNGASFVAIDTTTVKAV